VISRFITRSSGCYTKTILTLLGIDKGEETMALSNCYVQVYGQIPEFFSKLKEGQAPEKFTRQHLKDIGFRSSTHHALIPLLKSLNFLSADGTPTQRYHDFRDKSQSSKVLGQAIKEAYADLFVIKENPTEKDKELIQGKFISVHNVKERPAELMAKTFFALLSIADTSSGTKPSVKKETKKETIPDEKSSTKKDHTTLIASPGLNYNIQIHLPATKDIEVYNSIFKSLREHLIG
jgi:hypothetical protein